ncbi:MAG: endonuclease VIII [Syntrophomonadaceae bacterium]|jgi:formamidopyrimidine-DNA glycosylase
MIEIPEAFTLASQMGQVLPGKSIVNVVAEQSPHKFAWYFHDPHKYHELLRGKTIDGAVCFGGLVEIQAGTAVILFGDGVRLRYHLKGEKYPAKHQLLIEFEDGSALSASVQMYGGLWAFPAGELDNPYYLVAREKRSPLTSGFDQAYFEAMISPDEVQKLSAKAFLATEQRIPGLGNGVLQDILHNAGVHPKRKINTLSDTERQALYDSIKTTLTQMTEQGGRDTEKDLFGQEGGYKTRLSKKTAGKPCSTCGTLIKKESYMGGSIYFCPECQRI